MPPRQRFVEDDQDIPAARDRAAPQDSFGAMMDEEQVLVQDVINKLRILNDETRSILDERIENFKKMIWTREILEHLCRDQRWDGTEETLSAVWSRYYGKEQ
jgi:hypothetical protein